MMFASVSLAESNALRREIKRKRRKGEREREREKERKIEKESKESLSLWVREKLSGE